MSAKSGLCQVVHNFEPERVLVNDREHPENMFAAIGEGIVLMLQRGNRNGKITIVFGEDGARTIYELAAEEFSLDRIKITRIPPINPMSWSASEE
jgi:Na+-transporting NADH:ubiquinone oxidoreductase subunit NqrA